VDARREMLWTLKRVLEAAARRSSTAAIPATTATIVAIKITLSFSFNFIPNPP
jgi:hypothetical protein